MHTKVLVHIFFFAFLLAINSHALSAPRIRVLPSSESLKKPVYFSNISKTIPLELTGATECLNVTATLWQLTTRLGAVLSQHSIIDCKKTTHNFSQASVKLNFDFTPPVVKHDSQFKLEFTSCNEQKSCKNLGDLTFSVLPDDLLEPIIIWAKKHILYVNDRSGVLQSFLDENSIEYIESQRLIPKNETLISLIVIATKDMEIDKLLPTAKTQAVILFRQYPTELPIIIDKTNRATPLIDVQIPLIEKLAKDAATQKLFLKLFYMLPQTIVIN